MKVAVMQPYFFPYIGYYQLFGYVDKFIFFNDVNFIKKGWVNRNKILVNGSEYMFTVPLADASQNRLISECRLAGYAAWREKFIRTIEMNYKKAAHFNETFGFLHQLLYSQEFQNLEDLCVRSIVGVFEFLDPGNITAFSRSSELNYNRDAAGGEEKILSICAETGATQYINPVGGKDLYSAEHFRTNGLELGFLKTDLEHYRKKVDLPNYFYLSMIEIMFQYSREEIGDMLHNFVIEHQAG